MSCNSTNPTNASPWPALSRGAHADAGLGALCGVKVVDFSVLLPGPLATLFLAEAGADVLKIERPVTGDEMRGRTPAFGDASAQFALLNRGKRSLAIDLKAPDAVARLRGVLQEADVLIEQFRPGVMDKLGLGYDSVRALNPRIIYCSLTGYGQDGERAQVAGHDLNYVATSGLLSLSVAADGTPAMPAAMVGDIAGGTYPALLNVLLALQQRARTGEGCRLDIAMAENLFPFMVGALARGLSGGAWPLPEPHALSGASPRYRMYRTADDRFIAVAALEDRFWANFCAAIGLNPEKHVPPFPAGELATAVATILRTRSAAEWEAQFSGKDVCACVVRSVEEAVADTHFRARGAFAAHVVAGEQALPALPLPIAAALTMRAMRAGFPALGGDNPQLPDPE